MLRYPETRRGDVVETLHGDAIADPYRWLEDAASAETRAWVETQSRLTESWLEPHQARAERVRQRHQRLMDYEQFGVPFREGDRYFYSYNPGLKNQRVLLTTTALEQPATVLLDPNELADDGTVALTEAVASPDGRYLAYALATAGSDWRIWRVRDTETGRDLDDRIEWSKFTSASWSRDSSGFYYGAFDPPAPGTELTGTNYYQKLFYHRLGTAQAEDKLIYERPDYKDWAFLGTATEDGRYLVIEVTRGTAPERQLLVLDVADPDAAPSPLRTGFDGFYQYVGNVGCRFFLHTDRGAARRRLVAVDLERPDEDAWDELIGETDDTLKTVTRVGDFFVAQYLHHVTGLVRVHDLGGRPLHTVELPAHATVAGFAGSARRTETFFATSRFTEPWAIYRYDVATGEQALFRKAALDFDPDAYATTQVFVTSKDGTRVPMFLTHKKGLPVEGDNPTFLYGYGGFNVPVTPAYSPSFVVWMEHGGVLAVANLRGGNEYGEAWHQAGMRANKQNVFDDFIAAAEWLVAERYTRPERLAIAGGSNGGLLTGACLTQRPDLFGAVFTAMPVLDLLRYHRWTIGWAWTPEYGDPDDPADFAVLKAYSPLHRIEPGTRYPATLIATADHDDRVVPAHAYKFTAALQAAQAGDAPVLLRVDTRAGHGEGKPTDKQIAEMTDRFVFLSAALGMRDAGG